LRRLRGRSSVVCEAEEALERLRRGVESESEFGVSIPLLVSRGTLPSSPRVLERSIVTTGATDRDGALGKGALRFASASGKISTEAEAAEPPFPLDGLGSGDSPKLRFKFEPLLPNSRDDSTYFPKA
jgi:hypothetical protein